MKSMIIPCVRGEPDAVEVARSVRRAAARRPTAERPHGVSPSTLHIPFDPEAAALFFALVSSRDERHSLIHRSVGDTSSACYLQLPLVPAAPINAPGAGGPRTGTASGSVRHPSVR